jgi:hypothetical protein
MGCAQPGRPGVYSRVSGAYDWIFAQICTKSDNPPKECGNTPRKDGNKQRIRVDVSYYVEVPADVSWSIENENQDDVASSEAGEISDSVLVSKYFDLEPGEYQFKSNNLDNKNGEYSRLAGKDSCGLSSN